MTAKTLEGQDVDMMSMFKSLRETRIGVELIFYKQMKNYDSAKCKLSGVWCDGFIFSK